MPNRSTRSLRLLGIMLTVLLGSAMLVPTAQHVQGAPAVPAFSIFVPLVVNDSSAAAVPPAPPPTTSYYLTTSDPFEAQLLGCSAAVEMQQKNIADGVVILFFGQPAYQKSFFGGGTYGTIFPDNSRFVLLDTSEGNIDTAV